MEEKYYYYIGNRQDIGSMNNRPTLQLGDQNDYVNEAQKYLVEVGFLRGIPNGIFGINTKRAVELFQLFNNLPRTGIVDNSIWEALEDAINNPLPSTRPTLSEGDQGPSVKLLQLRLVVLGFLEQVSPTGLFDKNTKDAVIAFQTNRGITADGIANADTWRAIDQSFAATETNIPTIKPDVQEGETNDYVKLLQNMLTAFGYFTGNVDGIFGRNTTNAVKRLQNTYGLDPTGIVDYNTWEVLDSLLSPTFIHVPLLKEGSTVPEVFVLQQKLKLTGFFPGTITGSFGPETTLALTNFQNANGLPATGMTDRETWRTLFLQTASFDQYYRQFAVVNRPTLRYGDQGEYVKELQRDLKQVMFLEGEIDGIFGKNTLDAVKAFQTNNKLTADGVVGRNTWSALIYLYSPLAICPGVTPPPSGFKGVVIDAGHGGTDPGASGNGIIEKEFTLKMSQYMANRFRELGVPFAMTRTTDETLTPAERVNRVNNAFGASPDVILISNHLNAGVASANGAEVFYALRNTPVLAQKILDEIGKEGMTKRGVFQRTLPDDPTQDYYYVIRETKPIQSLLVEYGFMTNVSDAIKIKDNWEGLAEATVRGVMSYIGKPYTPPTAGKVVHIVRAGDTLFAIANRYNTTVDAIMRLNNLTSTSLTIGQELLISGTEVTPTPPSGNIVYIVKAGDSLYSIARKFNTTVDEIRRLNNLTSDLLSIGQQLFIPGVSVEVPETNLQVYTVQAGDSLYSIAVRFNTTVDELIRINNLTSTILSIGQRLLVPSTEVATFTYTVQPGDTLFSIANRFNTTVSAIKSLNNLTSNNLSIGQQLLIPGTKPPAEEYFIYTVVSGDSLWSIANRFGTTVDAIKRLNNLTSNLLSMGQQLKIPA